jgi:hypothetical protein
MPWKCWPIPKDAPGQPALHYTNVDSVLATWTDDGALQRAFIASVGHLAAEKKLDLRILQGDGTNTVAQTGARGLATRATSINKASRASP